MIYYSRDDKRAVIDGIRYGKSVSEIMTETGMSKSTVCRIKRKLLEEDPAIKDKSLKIGISIGILEEAIPELIKANKFESATEIANQVISNDNIDDNTKAIMRKHLVKIAILERRCDDAKSMVNEVLDNENVLDEVKNMLKRKFITIAIAEGDYDEAEKVAYQLLTDEDVTQEEKTKIQSQLLTVAIRKGEYSLAKYRIEELLKPKDITCRTKYIVLSQMIGLATAERRYNDARRIIKKRLRGINIDDIIEYALVLQSRVRDTVKTQASGKEEIVEDLLKTIPKIDPPEEIIPQVEQLQGEREPKVGDISNSKEFITNGIEIVNRRMAIYRNEIDMGDIHSLAEQNKGTLDGCLFIAETCAYFELQHLGSNCLKAYRKNHPNIECSQMKIISKALEVLKRDFVSKQRMKEEWDKVYASMPTTEQGNKEVIIEDKEAVVEDKKAVVEDKEVRIFMEEHEASDDEIEQL